MASRTHGSVLALLLLGSAVGLSSCSGSDDETGSASSAGRTSLPSFEVKLVSSTDHTTPLEGFIVTLDRGFIEVERTTDGNGIASFAGVDPRAERLVVTSYKPGYKIVSAFDVGELAVETGRGTLLEMSSAPIKPKLAVTSGLAKMHDFSDQLFVSADVVPSTEYQGPGGLWTIGVPEKKPFNLFAFEFRPKASPAHAMGFDVLSWASFAVPSAGTFWLNLTQSLPHEQVHGTFKALKAQRPAASITKPAGVYEPGAIAFMNVMGSHGRPLIGISTETTLNSKDGVWAYEAEFVRALAESKVVWQVSQLSPYSASEGQAASTILFKGYPMNGNWVDDLPAIPELKVSGPLAMNDTIAWASVGGHQANELLIRAGDLTGPVVWNVMMSERRSSLVLPSLPAGAGLPANLPLAVSVRHCVVEPSFYPWLCKAASVSRSVWMLPLAPAVAGAPSNAALADTPAENGLANGAGAAALVTSPGAKLGNAPVDNGLMAGTACEHGLCNALQFGRLSSIAER